MKYLVEKVSHQTWVSRFSEMAHVESFGLLRPRDIERMSFALVSVANDKPTGFVQCIEMDSETLYWQSGGMFLDIQKTIGVVPSYLAGIDWSLNNYKRITTRIDSENIRMLHLAMKMGFRVRGTWNFENRVYVELLNEVKNG